MIMMPGHVGLGVQPCLLGRPTASSFLIATHDLGEYMGNPFQLGSEDGVGWRNWLAVLRSGSLNPQTLLVIHSRYAPRGPVHAQKRIHVNWYHRDFSLFYKQENPKAHEQVDKCS